MSQSLATLSLDLDDKWAYLRTHGDPTWEDYPSYLPSVLPRILEFLADRELRITIFVVGRDAQRDANRDLLTGVIAAGHEVGNHSMNHLPWLASLPRDAVEREVDDAERAIEELIGSPCVGFRAPGFSGSPELLEVLAARGYRYDASVFPTFLGPLARWYCRLTSRSRSAGAPTSKRLFGSWRDGVGSLKPFVVNGCNGTLVEIPVTTMPVLRLPFHMTYLLFLRQKFGPLWRIYLRAALRLCALRGVAPSMLLHPLDFLGAEDEPKLSFFPGMKLPRAAKLEVVSETLRLISDRYRVVPLAEAAAAVCGGVAAIHSAAYVSADVDFEPAVI